MRARIVGIGDLVAIEMQDRQHRAIGHRIEKFVGMPGRRQRPGFRFAVADHASNDQIRIIEHRAERMAQRIPQFAAFMNRPRASPARHGWESRRETKTA